MPPGACLQAADWSAPWFAAVADDARRIDWRDPQAALAGLNAIAAARALRVGSGQPLRFVEAASAGAEPYEQHVARSGCVPTRLQGDGFVHDALGALVWLAFARTKAALNALHAAQMARGAVGPGRGALRDAATLFDENALVLAVDAAAPGAQAIVQALRQRRWRAALADGAARALWHAQLVPVALGHALMQKLLDPFATVTAHAWVVDLPAGWFELPDSARLQRLDEALAARLETRLAHRAARLPLPVLGIPGWWPADAQARLYDDQRVFRPAGQPREPAPQAGPGR